MAKKIFTSGAFKNEIKMEISRLNDKLDKLEKNKNGQQYGWVQMSPLTGAGKSVASKEFCDEKIADMIKKR